MNSTICALAAAGLLAASMWAKSAGNDAISQETYLPIEMEAGTWDADVTFYESGKPSEKGKGVQVNTLLANGHWITNDFRIPASEKFPTYQGHGVWGYDPVAKTYVNTWIDTNDQSVRTDYGFWNAKDQTMVWSSKQNDGAGHFVDYRMTEEFRGSERIFTVYQIGMYNPKLHPLLKIVFTRRDAGIPRAGD